ncbi:GTPase-associated protein 1-related protein [Actinoplanes sp. NPDC049596]|uniref:GTPase-associated protein 1-related protein n=1 Tax=unclassified Actinoplanes TaxID=2626549 RepID=UPI0034217C5F
MTGRFDTYIYTNCRAGEGLESVAGFQFQAMSPEANLHAMPLIRNRLLYEAPVRWMSEQRPIADYPPSFAHVHDRFYATGAGLYLGREPTGGREGNQLTHAIATDDPGAYGLVRPAQLFGAPFWTTVPAPAKQCPPLEPGWQPGPFGAPEAQQFVRAHDRGPALLTALLSHLRRGDRDPRRVLFVARDAEAVLRWITAATLLVPHREALRIDFKVFAPNPAYAAHRILAVHPEWSGGPAGLDQEQGFVVIDLERNGWTRLADDPDSRRWVDLFLSEDPYDIADAVEVAAEATAADSGLRPAQTSFALAVVLGRPPEPDAIRPIVGWLLGAPAGLIDRYGDDLVDRLLTEAARWPAEDLIRLDAAIARNLPGRAVSVRLALLRAELRETGQTHAVRTEKLPAVDPRVWDREAERTAAGLLAEAMCRAEPEVFERLLRLAARFRLAPAHNLLDPGLERFIAFWAANPQADYRSELWADGVEVERKLRRLLLRRVTGDPVETDRLGDLWWESLLTQPADLDTEFDRAIVSAAMLSLDARQRSDFVEEMLLEARNGPDPGPALGRLAVVLWRRTAPTAAEARRLVSLMPPNFILGPGHFPILADAMREPKVAEEHFQAADALTGEPPAWQPAEPVRRSIADERAIRQVMDLLDRESAPPRRLTALMRRIPGRVVLRHAGALLDAMVRAPVAAARLAVLTETLELRWAYAERITRELLYEEWRAVNLATAFILQQTNAMEDRYYPDRREHVLSHPQRAVLAELGRAVTDFARRASGSRLEAVNKQIDLLPDPWPADWAKYIRDVRPRGAIGRIVRRDG